MMPYRVFRHFAFITLMVTALIALFATGESGGVSADGSGGQATSARRHAAGARRGDPAQIVRRGANDQNYYSASEAQNFGRPTTEIGSNSIGPPADTAPISEIIGREPIPGYSSADLDALTEEEYRQLLRELQTAGMINPADRERNLADLKAWSRQRSSTATEAD